MTQETLHVAIDGHVCAQLSKRYSSFSLYITRAEHRRYRQCWKNTRCPLERGCDQTICKIVMNGLLALATAMAVTKTKQKQDGSDCGRIHFSWKLAFSISIRSCYKVFYACSWYVLAALTYFDLVLSYEMRQDNQNQRYLRFERNMCAHITGHIYLSELVNQWRNSYFLKAQQK